MLLREILDTVYLVNEYADDIHFLIYQFVSCKQKGVHYDINIYATKVKDAINQAIDEGKLVLDIAGCRFTAPVWNELSQAKQYRDIITIFDSEDVPRNKYIQEFMKFEYQYKHMPHVRGLPGKPAGMESLVPWVESLDRNVVYELIDEEYQNNPSLIMAINILAPEVKMILYNRPFMEYAKMRFSRYMLESCKEFYYLFGQQDEMIEAYADEDDNILITNIGVVNKAVFVRKYLCMPRFIGNRKVTLTGAPESLRGAIKSVLQDTSNYLAMRPTTIGTYFAVKEDYTT